MACSVPSTMHQTSKPSVRRSDRISKKRSFEDTWETTPSVRTAMPRKRRRHALKKETESKTIKKTADERHTEIKSEPIPKIADERRTIMKSMMKNEDDELLPFTNDGLDRNPLAVGKCFVLDNCNGKMNYVAGHNYELPDNGEIKEEPEQSVDESCNTANTFDEICSERPSIIDVMIELVDTMPSWTLSVTPNSAQYIISQIVIGTNGVPTAQKSVVVDPDFNASVYVNQQFATVTVTNRPPRSGIS